MNNFPKNLIIILCLLFLSNYGICQLDLVWSLETPAGENHRFRDIAVNVSEQKMYISDSYTDVVYVYSTKDPSAPINTITDPSWQGWIGPYGLSIAEDQKLYIAVMLLEDKDYNQINDFSLWRCTPSGRDLKRVCTLPDPARGIKVVGGGRNTLVYASGSSGNMIRCRPEKNPHNFRPEILFGITATHQQDILVTKDRKNLYTSYWSMYTPFGSTVARWELVGDSWQPDDDFTISDLIRGNNPAIDFGLREKWLYVFQIGIYGNNSHVFRIEPQSGSHMV